MRLSVVFVPVLAACTCLGCGNKPTNDYDITKDPNYHENPDPRSYSNLYDGSNLDPKQDSKKGKKNKRSR